MFDGLISGRLVREPRPGFTRAGKPLTTALLRVTCENAEDSMLANVIAFEAQAEALGKLGPGDSVSVSGPCRLTQWESGGELRVGIAVTALAVMSAYRRRAKRQEAPIEPWEVYEDGAR